MNSIPPKRRRTSWRRMLLIAVAGYLGILVLLLALERRLIFYPLTAAQEWRAPPDSRITDVRLVSSTGERIHAWWLPHPNAIGALLYSHGNALNLSHRGGSIVRWAQELKVSVLIYDYPGYGKSTGKPEEVNCYSAAEAAWDWLTNQEKIDPQRIVLVGASLGGAMATELSAKHDCRALVLIKAFTSIPDMASHRFPWLPARYFVRNRFDCASRLAESRCPTFIVHGTDDQVVPYFCGEKLYSIAREPKEFLRLAGNDHNDALPADFFARIRSFLELHAPLTPAP
jgi:fermentation-respiration switch protein FrsA (DUF1100 family)